MRGDTYIPALIGPPEMFVVPDLQEIHLSSWFWAFSLFKLPRTPLCEWQSMPLIARSSYYVHSCRQ